MEYQEFVRIVSSIAQVPAEQVLPHHALQGDLGIDSLRMVNLLLTLSEGASLDLNRFQSMEEVRTVAGLFNIVKGV